MDKTLELLKEFKDTYAELVAMNKVTKMYYDKEKLFAVILGEIIVNECLDRNLDINTSKLMKLLYLMQKLHLQKYGTPMFNDEVVATKNGPYISEVANYFIKGRLGFDEPFETRIILLKSHEDVVSTILTMYGNKSANELLEFSLKDELFKVIWADGKGDNMVIPFAALANNKEVELPVTLRKRKK